MSSCFPCLQPRPGSSCSRRILKPSWEKSFFLPQGHRPTNIKTISIQKVSTNFSHHPRPSLTLSCSVAPSSSPTPTGTGARLSAVSSACSWAGATMTTRQATRTLDGGTSKETQRTQIRRRQMRSTWTRIATRVTTSPSASAVTSDRRVQRALLVVLTCLL